ncbi:hypothetical protein PILCRDRAFT_816764 [Piloderma croceum F 1598]|uniref:Autophagy-related protein 14 n=1 Tax=Piloderma croceum (strain F 1598) TaxID=765440 RepID=A0A0C3BGY6_PILCF|nr:hypothetical protein PILCRDRAFT_816764 [Piloderma croceum F 1598]
MECKNCELRQRQFFCENCLRTHLRDKRLQTQRFAADRDGQVAKASKLLGSVSDGRLRRAEVANCQDQVEDVLCSLASLRKDNENKRERLKLLRENIANRRRTLAMAVQLSPPPPLNHLQSQESTTLSNALARARSGLVQELVEVFNVVEVGGRPPIGGKAGTKGEWTICELVLPVPGDIRRYPPDHINAVITHTIHFLGLLAFYLGVKLPFEISWSGKKFGVGQPWIGACRGTESGNWAKWFQKHPLHLSASSSALISPTSPTESLPLSESYIIPSEASQSSSFTTAFAMLLYNVTYLGYTQSVEIPLSQAGEVLSNLWAVCCSPDLGRRSHQTTPLLPAPTPPSFPLDFAQLLQATAATPTSRARSKSSKGHTHSTAKAVREKIVEEEEGWDLVDDVGSA